MPKDGNVWAFGQTRHTPSCNVWALQMLHTKSYAKLHLGSWDVLDATPRPMAKRYCVWALGLHSLIAFCKSEQLPATLPPLKIFLQRKQASNMHGSDIPHAQYLKSFFFP